MAQNKIVIVKAERDVETIFTKANQIIMSTQEDGSLVLNLVVYEDENIHPKVISDIKKVFNDMGFKTSKIMVQHTPRVEVIEDEN